MTKTCPKCGAELDGLATVCHVCSFIVVGEDEPVDEPSDDLEVIPEGTLLKKDYRIVRLLGTGGSGVVYEARQISLQNARVAVKVLHPDLHEDENTIKLLQREVLITRELTHQNIMKVYSLEKMDKDYFIVMEYVLGGSLQNKLDSVGKLPMDKAGEVFLQACDALDYAHGRGIIHLDIKPANLLIGPGGMIKLCDFGIARMAVSHVTTATQRIITGSVGFMPPEQYRGRKFVSEKSDVYALGATLYTALTGEVPIGIIEPEGIPESLLRAMQRNPEDRFKSINEFREAFIVETGLQPIPTAAATTMVTLPGSEALEENRVTVKQEKSGTIEGPVLPPEATERMRTVRETAGYEDARTKSPVPLQEEYPLIPDSTTSADRVSLPAIRVPARVAAGKKVYMGAGIGLAVLIVLVIGIAFTWNTTEDKGTGVPARPRSGKLTSSSATLASVQTVNPDQPTVNEINSNIKGFVESLNFDLADQAASFLTQGLRDRMTMEQFRKRFFRTPRLWEMKVLTVGKTSDGRIVAKVRIKFVDALEGDIRSSIAWIEMTKLDASWKISRLEFG
jgi:serine/threonine protein kinase